MAEQFKEEPGEQVLLKQAMNHIEGELGVMNYMRGKVKITRCVGVLTDRRLVAWSKPNLRFPIFSPIAIWIARFIKGRPIQFSVPLNEISAIKTGADVALIIISGQKEYKINFESVFNPTEKWVQSMINAVTQAQPGIHANRMDGLVEFRRD